MILDNEIRDKIINKDKLPQYINWNIEKGWDLYKIKYKNKPKLKIIRWSIAAVIVLMIISIGILFLSKPDNNIIELSTLNEKTDISLRDGSKVWLNANSHIVINQNQIEIIGEAYFKLSGKNKYRIVTPQGILVGYNCHFNIKARKDTKFSILTVSNGNVSILWNADINLDINVSSGFEAKIVPSVAVIQRPIVDINFLAWKTEELYFDNTPLFYVIEKLEELNNIKINLSRYDLRYCRISSDFNSISTDVILNKLSDYLDCQIYQNGKVITIEGKGC